MPLILAIDRDKRQSAQLASLVRTQLQAELVQSATADEGLAQLAGRIPDLVLTSSLLSPKDDAALANHLRELGQATGHVQTITIPQLGPPAPKRAKGGVLSALRREKVHSVIPDGCAPELFADQIRLYLDTAAEQKAASEARSWTPDAPQTEPEWGTSDLTVAAAEADGALAADDTDDAVTTQAADDATGGEIDADAARHSSEPLVEPWAADALEPAGEPGPDNHATAEFQAAAFEAPGITTVEALAEAEEIHEVADAPEEPQGLPLAQLLKLVSSWPATRYADSEEPLAPVAPRPATPVDGLHAADQAASDQATSAKAASAEAVSVETASVETVSVETPSVMADETGDAGPAVDDPLAASGGAIEERAYAGPSLEALEETAMAAAEATGLDWTGHVEAPVDAPMEVAAVAAACVPAVTAAAEPTATTVAQADMLRHDAAEPANEPADIEDVAAELRAPGDESPFGDLYIDAPVADALAALDATPPGGPRQDHAPAEAPIPVVEMRSFESLDSIAGEFGLGVGTRTPSRLLEPASAGPAMRPESWGAATGPSGFESLFATPAPTTPVFDVPDSITPFEELPVFAQPAASGGPDTAPEPAAFAELFARAEPAVAHHAAPATAVPVPADPMPAAIETRVDGVAFVTPAVAPAAVDARGVEAPEVEARAVDARAVEAWGLEAPAVEAPAIEARAVEATTVEAPIHVSVDAPVEAPVEAPPLPEQPPVEVSVAADDDAPSRGEQAAAARRVTEAALSKPWLEDIAPRPEPPRGAFELPMDFLAEIDLTAEFDRPSGTAAQAGPAAQATIRAATVAAPPAPAPAREAARTEPSTPAAAAESWAPAAETAPAAPSAAASFAFTFVSSFDEAPDNGRSAPATSEDFGLASQNAPEAPAQSGPVLDDEALSMIGEAARKASLDALVIREFEKGLSSRKHGRKTKQKRTPVTGHAGATSVAPSAEQLKPAKKKGPVQDEWGMFDPEQCGFAALEDDADANPDAPRTTPRDGTRVRVISY